MVSPIIPVYLNQRIVFDLLAMLQDGLSEVARISTTESGKDAMNRNAGATFGVAGAFASLLRINLSGSRASTKETTTETLRSEERVHTPASLLFKLRQMLVDRSELTTVSGVEPLKPGQIIEFTTTLRRNPILELMDAVISGYNFYIGWSSEGKGDNRPKHGKQQPAPSQPEKLLKQMNGFREMLLAGDTVDIVSDRLASGHSAVITLEQEFLSDPSMSNLVEGEFSVLGKVIRLASQQESIGLLRKTAVSVLPVELLSKAFSHFDSLTNTQGWSLPKAEWRVNGPAIHILPIGIYA